MFPYWLLFTVFAAGSLQYGRRRMAGVTATPVLAVAGLLVALMIGFRYEVGGDWQQYEDIYRYVGGRELVRALDSTDPGYALLNWIGRQLKVEIWFVNLVCALIFTWGLVRFARRQPNPWLAIVVAIPYLIIVVAMGYTRQGVAIGLILAGLAVVDRTSLLRFSIYIAVAATFHKSAVIVLPIVALSVTRDRITTVGILILTGALLYYLFVQESVDRLMTYYIAQKYTSQGALVRVAMNIPPALIFLLAQKRFQLGLQERKLWRNFAIAAFGALIILWRLPDATTAVDRIALYLIPLQIFVLSRVAHAFPDKGRADVRLILLVIAYSAAIQYVWLTMAQNASFWIPYRVYPLTAEY